MMAQIATIRAKSPSYVTMRITSLPGSANRLPYLAAPVPILAQPPRLVNFRPSGGVRQKCGGIDGGDSVCIASLDVYNIRFHFH